MKATLLLKKDHEVLQSQLNDLTDAFRKDQDPQLGELQREIGIHAQLEMEFLYPELQNSALPEAVAAAERGVADYEAIQEMLREINKMGLQQARSSSRVQTLISKVHEHFEFEEEQLFEEARKILSEYRLEELGLEIEERRKFLQMSAA